MGDDKRPEPGAGPTNDQQPATRFDATLPLAGGGAPAGELDLDVDGIETRLPYGSEDIADK